MSSKAKKRKPKPMFSLKKRASRGGGESDDDPIVRDWRMMWQAVQNMGRASITEALLLLAVKLPPFNGRLITSSDDPGDVPPELHHRVEELKQYLVEVGEIDWRMGPLEAVEPFTDSVRARLHASDENVAVIPTMAAIAPVLREAWDVVNRELPGPLWQRIMHSAALIYSAMFLDKVGGDPEHMNVLFDALCDSMATWVYANRAELLTPDEAEDMRGKREARAPETPESPEP